MWLWSLVQLTAAVATQEMYLLRFEIPQSTVVEDYRVIVSVDKMIHEASFQGEFNGIPGPRQERTVNAMPKTHNHIQFIKFRADPAFVIAFVIDHVIWFRFLLVNNIAVLLTLQNLQCCCLFITLQCCQVQNCLAPQFSTEVPFKLKIEWHLISTKYYRHQSWYFKPNLWYL